MTSLHVERGDITRLAVDAVVNAANETMLGGGGVDGAIHDAAGPELHLACRQVPEIRPGVRCLTGSARITEGFRLPARYVIHTVGPIWRGGDQGEDELLASCYIESCRLAQEHNLETIAFPAISCGAFGYPLMSAARTAAATLSSLLAEADFELEVTLVAFEVEVEQALREAVGGHAV